MSTCESVTYWAAKGSDASRHGQYHFLLVPTGSNVREGQSVLSAAELRPSEIRVDRESQSTSIAGERSRTKRQDQERTTVRRGVPIYW